jgi:hypothetical protein
VYHFEPENKRQSTEYRHKGSPAPKKFKAAPSGGKVMLIAFWDVNGAVHSEFMPTGTTNVGAMQKLKTRIRKVCPDMEQLFLQHDKASRHSGA